MSPLPWIDMGPIMPVPPAARWDLEDTGSTAVDASGNSHTGTFQGTLTKGVDGAVAPSKCIELDGTTGHVSVSASTILTNISNVFTLAAWIYPTATRSAADSIVGIISKIYAGAHVPWCLSYGNFNSASPSIPSNCVGLAIFNGTAWFGLSDNNPAGLNTWTHFAVTSDGTRCKLYRNGVQVAEAAYAGSAGTGQGVYLGKRWDTGFFPGRIDDARIYATALTAPQIAAIYQTPAPKWLPAPEPIARTAHYLMDEPTGAVLGDETQQNNAALSGTYTRNVDGAVVGSKCVQFDGSSGYATAPASASFNAISQWSLAAWIYPTAAVAGSEQARGIVCRQGISPMQFALYYGSTSGTPDNCVGAATLSGSWKNAYDPTAVPLNTWTHYVATQDATRLKLYRNGVQVADIAATPTGASAAVVYVARRWDTTGGQMFPGRIDDVRIYPAALTAAEALAVYERQRGVARPWIPMGVVT